MTIASEITRLQNDKAAMCTAIENKGVTVGNVSLDCYASCIDAIAGGGEGEISAAKVEMLVVGGGGCGGHLGSYYGGGGGGGGIIHNTDVYVDTMLIHIGEGLGCSCLKGGDTKAGDMVAIGGGSNVSGYGCCGGSGAGNTRYTDTPGTGTPFQGNNGGVAAGSYAGGGGGGALGIGGNGSGCTGGNGGTGYTSDISGTTQYYSWGGGGNGCVTAGSGGCGGGNGGGKNKNGCDATSCGSGGGGSSSGSGYIGGKGACGVVIARYPTACGYNLYGGCKYMCGAYTIHCFCEDGALILHPSSGKFFHYLIVGGGGGGCSASSRGGGGGGGGAVCCGLIKPDKSSYCVKIGTGGNAGVSGTASCLCASGFLITAPGGSPGMTNTNNCANMCGGTSGSGCKGGCNTALNSSYNGGGGGGGAMLPGCSANGQVKYGAGGAGFAGYGGGGGGGLCSTSGGANGRDGGGQGGYSSCICCNAVGCGGGGGGSYTSAGGKGGGGLVEICYACDGSRGINSATGGNCCYLCGDICVHRFTSNGTFTIVS